MMVETILMFALGLIFIFLGIAMILCNKVFSQWRLKELRSLRFLPDLRRQYNEPVLRIQIVIVGVCFLASGLILSIAAVASEPPTRQLHGLAEKVFDLSLFLIFCSVIVGLISGLFLRKRK